MGFWDKLLGREERSSVNASWTRLIPGWGDGANGIACTPDLAIKATPVFAAVDFLSSAMATVSLHVMRRKGEGSERVTGGLASLLDGAVNDEWSSFRWRKYSFWQTLTGGRQYTWIERPNGRILNLWPLDPKTVTIVREPLAGGGYRTVYRVKDGNREITYPAADIIDIPFALEADQLTHISPLVHGSNAIGLILAMEKYANSFFAGGGVLPLSVEGPMPAGNEAVKRMTDDIDRAIKQAQESKKQIFPLPPGYSLKPVGFDPEKGQMTDARRFQVEEVARIYNLPPWFLQDLTNANFANSENQDLHLVKHTLAHWVRAAEQELNLKLFGRRSNSQWVEFNMDSLLRGDIKSRFEALARGVQSALMTPNEGRKFIGGIDKSDDPNADKLFIQGATVPLGTQPNNTGAQPPADGGLDDDGA